MERSKKYLSDILTAIERIESFTIETQNFHDYENDLKTQSAAERQLGIIGKALNKLRQLNQDIKIENDKQIIGFRNRLVHAYDGIDNAIVWAIIQRHLDKLKLEISVLQI